jgi:hypothetical protein
MDPARTEASGPVSSLTPSALRFSATRNRIGRPGQGEADHHGDLILISALHPSLFPQDRICDLHQNRPLVTAVNRMVSMDCGPNVDQAGPLSGPVGLDQGAPGPHQVFHKGFEAYCEASAYSPLDGVIADCSTSASAPWRSSRPASASPEQGAERRTPTRAARDSRGRVGESGVARPRGWMDLGHRGAHDRRSVRRIDEGRTPRWPRGPG